MSNRLDLKSFENHSWKLILSTDNNYLQKGFQMLDLPNQHVYFVHHNCITDLPLTSFCKSLFDVASFSKNASQKTLKSNLLPVFVQPLWFFKSKRMKLLRRILNTKTASSLFWLQSRDLL
jgi:hypothetical protein